VISVATGETGEYGGEKGSIGKEVLSLFALEGLVSCAISRRTKCAPIAKGIQPLRRQVKGNNRDAVTVGVELLREALNAVDQSSQFR
jgi:hypothetical protein